MKPAHAPRARRRAAALRLAPLAAALWLCACAATGPAVGPAATPPATSTATVPAAAATARPVAVPGSFADNPIVYFVITDRFANGDPTNDGAYGRQREPGNDAGTFHGGDLRGLKQKLDEGWFRQLGVNAIWITAPYEQIHGWTQGGQASFKHYGYHGYYALDYTRLDQAMGTPDDLRALVDAAHAQGIRILFDVVMNHPGYLDLQTARELLPEVLWPGSEQATLKNYHSFFDYNSFEFGKWWGRDWVRAGLPGYTDPGRDDLTSQLAHLPDFRTENPQPVKLPEFLRRKADTGAVDLPNTSVRGYLVRWLTDWVREYGIDGFRADTVKHVEPEAWAELKREATKALADWKARHPQRKIDDAPFWMVGEYWGQGPSRSPLHDSGFDALLDFDFQQRAAQYTRPEALFARYAATYAGRPGFSNLAYLSSHDTTLFDRARLHEAATALMLAPGGVQIFYGDETARPPGEAPRGDEQQATRSDMNWGSADAALLAHWRKLGSFRQRHVALARGRHAQLQAAPYAFSRVDAASGDAVVVAMDVSAAGPVNVAGVFAEGERLVDAYSGQAHVVQGGQVQLQPQRLVLLERAPAR